MSRYRFTRARGSALLIVIVLVVIILGLSGAMMTQSLADGRNAELAVAESRSLAIAEAGAHAAIADLIRGGSGTLGTSASPVNYNSGMGTNASTYYTQVFSNPDGTRSIVSRSNYEGYRKGVEMVVMSKATTIDYRLRAGITTQSSVQASGNFVGDGRDWNDTGTAIVGPGLLGISSMSIITVKGSSQVGGNGIAPTSNPGPTIIEQAAVWPNGYPAGPDQALNLPLGTLKAAAIGSGTYCASQAQWDALRLANGGQTPSGKIIYIETDIVTPMECGSALNADPSILVLHNATSTAVAKNIHGYFKGLFLSDDIDHENAGSLVVGAIMTFRPTTGGNVFGNGAANFRFSSAVLSRLPRPGANQYSIVSWREFPAFIAGQPPVAKGG